MSDAFQALSRRVLPIAAAVGFALAASPALARGRFENGALLDVKDLLVTDAGPVGSSAVNSRIVFGPDGRLYMSAGGNIAAEAVAALAQIHEEIVAMPMGYQTLVGDMGSTLSGGQRQRILLARALYKQPMILALDEATSSLDADNERHVNQAVKTLPLTRITIAHRQETINAAQRVIVLGRGQVEREMRAA